MSLMRKDTTIEIDGEIIVIREAGLDEIGLLRNALFEQSEQDGEQNVLNIASMVLGNIEVKKQLLVACTSLGDCVHGLGASSFLQIWEAFEELNSDFFDRYMALTGKAMGRLSQMRAGIEAAKDRKERIMKGLPLRSGTSSNADTARSTNTAGAGS